MGGNMDTEQGPGVYDDLKARLDALESLAKRLKQGDANMAAGKWGPRTGPLIGVEVRGRTLGLVGRACARRCWTEGW